MLCMKFLRNFCLLAVTFVALLCGCSESNEDDVKSAKRFEELKVLPLDTVLSRAFAFYEQFQATGDTLLRDSMKDYRDHFFARWELTSDSLCGTVAPDDSLAMELREINAAVMRYLVQQENRRAESIYYAQLLQVNYKDASSSGRMEKKEIRLHERDANGAKGYCPKRAIRNDTE